MANWGYHAVRLFLRLVLALFFSEHVPEGGPVVLAAVHTNALLDPSLLIATAPRPARFMAKDTLWNSCFFRFFLWLTASVPVKRRMDHGTLTAEEREAATTATFAALFETLGAGSCIGIFPEGISHAEPRMAPLRSGTARIALGYLAQAAGAPLMDAAASPASTASDADPLLAPRPSVHAMHPHQHTITIVPCGLSYLSRSSFRSRVLVEYGRPLVVGPRHLAAYQANPAEAVRALTAEIADALAGVTINADDWDTLRLVQMAKNAVAPTAALSDHVATTKAFLATYEAHREEASMRALRAGGMEYMTRLESIGLKDHHIATNVGIPMGILGFVARFVLFVVLLPFTLVGFFVHFPIYFLAWIVSRKMATDSLDTIATAKAILIVVFVPVIYISITVALTLVLNPWYAWLAICIVGLPLVGFATTNALIYGRKVFKGMRAVVTIMHWRAEVAELRALRHSLIDQLLAAWIVFGSETEPPSSTPTSSGAGTPIPSPMVPTPGAASTPVLPAVFGFGSNLVINDR
ncbi:acyltransferase domain-containing protein [Thecamonas trahens ATCC 50062]|uniref:Acyltransferase domain-containing protein n=1 Tax=Thecamonas trahens ATCC 50062 TaxID=461836 RepID=A0A0L0DF02_THETB|nr:acyltransferase domain-containing protein [Thecamonas trahens ATCC 50062]KNC50805.1 acyltransferase domain-containing protein [Thecamonas trahens ATCC 50062]|eukprot:XP_013756761.1 acyltransferase domain-containing protein [Thecamonas trahens ATCC 50062]